MTYTEGYNDGVMEAKYGIYATEANAAIDQLREAIGVDATEPLAVVDAVLKYVASLERRLWAPVRPCRETTRERQSHYVRVEDPPDGWVWLSNHFDENAEVMHELWANHRELEGRELRFVATRLVWRERFVTEWVDEDRGA